MARMRRWEPAAGPIVGTSPIQREVSLAAARNDRRACAGCANFFLADVRDGLGPYLAIYLLTEQKWDQASIGVVMSVAALAGIIAQTPAGALIDRSTAKRALTVAAAIVVTAACLALPLIQRFELVAATQRQPDWDCSLR